MKTNIVYRVLIRFIYNKSIWYDFNTEAKAIKQLQNSFELEETESVQIIRLFNSEESKRGAK